MIIIKDIIWFGSPIISYSSRKEGYLNYFFFVLQTKKWKPSNAPPTIPITIIYVIFQDGTFLPLGDCVKVDGFYEIQWNCSSISLETNFFFWQSTFGDLGLTWKELWTLPRIGHKPDCHISFFWEARRPTGRRREETAFFSLKVRQGACWCCMKRVNLIRIIYIYIYMERGQA